MRWRALAIGCLSWLMMGAATPQIWTGTFIPASSTPGIWTGDHIPDSVNSSSSAITRVIDYQYYRLNTFGGLHEVTTLCNNSTLDPGNSGCPAFETAAGIHGANMAVAVTVANYADASGPRLSSGVADLELEKWGCRDSVTGAACQNTAATPNACEPIEFNVSSWNWDEARTYLPVVFHNATTGRYFQNAIVGNERATGCNSATGGVIYLARELPMSGGDTVTVSAALFDANHHATTFNAYAAQRVSEAPKSATQFPADGGLMARGNMENFVVSTDQGKWSRNSANGTLAAVARNFFDDGENYSIHGKHGAYTGRTDATNDWVIQGDFVDMANRSGAIKSYYIREVWDCQSRKNEIRVSDLGGTDYTYIEADSQAISTNSYRVFYQDDASTTGWTSAPKYVPTGYPRVPECSKHPVSPALGTTRLVITTIGLPANAATQSFKKWTRIADPSNVLTTADMHWDESYMGAKEDPATLDLVDFLPASIDVGLYGDSNFPEIFPGGAACDETKKDIIQCGHLLFFLDQELTSIGGLVEDRSSALAGKTLCAEVNHHPNEIAVALSFFSFVGTTLEYLMDSRLVQSVLIGRYYNDGNRALGAVDGNKKVSEAEDCLDRSIDKIRGHDVDPILVMPPINAASTTSTGYLDEDGSGIPTAEWLDDMALRLIADGIIYNAD